MQANQMQRYGPIAETAAHGLRQWLYFSLFRKAGAILAFAKKLGIAPGLVVGRLQHDGILTWKQHNRLKREVDLSHVLGGAEAIEATWPDQSEATRQVMRDFGLNEAQARERGRRAAAGGAILTNGRERREMRLEPGQLAAWRLLMRDRDLDAEERDAA